MGCGASNTAAAPTEQDSKPAAKAPAKQDPPPATAAPKAKEPTKEAPAPAVTPSQPAAAAAAPAAAPKPETAAPTPAPAQSAPAPAAGKPDEGLKVVIAGPPACGKGAHCALIVKEFGVLHVSTGDVMREEVKKGSANGVTIKQRMQEGKDVEDELLVAVVAAKLKEPEIVKRGWLLDGFPRSAAQAEQLKNAGIKPDKFLLLTVSDDELVDRVSNRRLDPETGQIYHFKTAPPPDDPVIKARLIQRADDTPDKIKGRLMMFHKSVDSIRPYFDSIEEIDGNLTNEAMQTKVRDYLKR